MQSPLILHKFFNLISKSKQLPKNNIELCIKITKTSLNIKNKTLYLLYKNLTVI
jgi:hypothetical protein